VPKIEQAEPHILEENLTLARRFIEDVLGGGNPNSFDEIVADDIRVTSSLKPQGVIEGKGEYVHVLGRVVSGQFNDFDLVIEDIAPLVDGRVMARLRIAATHVGRVFGMPATGRRITVRSLFLMRFRDGKLAELLAGSLNPLEFEMLFAPAIRKLVFKDD
jgi:predicted ester cyclase